MQMPDPPMRQSDDCLMLCHLEPIGHPASSCRRAASEPTAQLDPFSKWWHLK
jgi:hypothetical protein